MKILYIVGILLLMPLAFALDAFPTQINITGNTTNLKLYTEESTISYNINDSYSYSHPFILYRNNSLQDDYDSISKAYLNLSGSYSWLVSNLNTSCFYNYTFYNSSVNFTYIYYNITNVTYINGNGTCNITCEEKEAKNLDYFKEYSNCYLNLTSMQMSLTNCQTEKDNLQGDSSCQDRLNTCTNLLGGYSSVGGTNCNNDLKNCLDENKSCTTEGWKIPASVIIGIILGIIGTLAFKHYNNPKNRGRSAGSDTMQTPFYPT